MNPTIMLHLIGSHLFNVLTVTLCLFFFIIYFHCPSKVGWSSVFKQIDLSFCAFQVVHHPYDVPGVLSVHCPQHSLRVSDLHQSLHWNQRQHCHLRPGAVC